MSAKVLLFSFQQTKWRKNVINNIKKEDLIMIKRVGAYGFYIIIGQR